jgi:DNA-binding CsgD family transcriptional regulator
VELVFHFLYPCVTAAGFGRNRAAECADRRSELLGLCLAAVDRWFGSRVGIGKPDRPWHPLIEPIGWGLAFGSVTFFALFGAIAGGLFIQVMAPILLILGGLSLRWLPLERIFPEPILVRLGLRQLPLISENALPHSSELVEPLSARELEVLQLVDQGLSNQEIAARLNIAASTVKTHINNIYSKLEVQTRTQAIRRARDLGLFQQ